MPPRRVVVTGASSGIGAAIAARLLAEGWSVLGVSRSPPADGIEHLPIDLAVPGAAAALAGTEATALVHAAGLLRVGALGGADPADARAMWRLHVEAATELVEALVPTMPDGGRIVLIGSRVAAGVAGRAQYAATKAAMVALARSWAAELVSRAITVNVVAPGATDTPMLRDPARGASAPRLPPMGRFVQPSEIAGLVAFLLSGDGASMTGQQLVVCAGADLGGR